MKNVNLRLEDNLHQLVKDAADTDHRSLNGEIAHLLEVALALRATRPLVEAIFPSPAGGQS